MSNLNKKYNEDDMQYVNFNAIGDLMEEDNKQAAEKQFAEKQRKEKQRKEKQTENKLYTIKKQ